jgi:hypothetical protein
MSRIRTIKPGFFLHADLFDLERESNLPIRVAFAGLWTVCDREGRFRWRPRELKPQVLPHDELDFAQVLETLERGHFVVRYEVDGAVFGYIPTWTRHQKPNHRESESEIPAPPGVVYRVPARIHVENELPFPAPVEKIAIEQNQSLDASTNSPGGRERDREGERNGKGERTRSSSDDASNPTPPNLTELEYARKMLDDLGMPERGNIVVVADSIRAFAKSKGLQLFVAFQLMLSIAHDVRDRGDPVTHFWFQDARYMNPRPKTKGDAYVERCTRERELLRETQTRVANA